MFLFAVCKKELKSTRSVPSRQGYRRKAEKGFNLFCARLLFVCADSRFTKPRNFSRGFNLVCMNVLSLCADSRFAKPRSFLKKVLIVAARSCGCGALIRGLQNLGAFLKKVLIVAVGSCRCGVLIRGLQNLGAFCKGIRVVTFCIVQKVTKKHAGRSPATHDSKLCRK